MNFFKKLFAQPNKQRTIGDVEELQINDIIVFDDSFALPQLLRSQQFMVSAVNSYEYEYHTDTEWVLRGSSQTNVYLSVDNDDERYLKLSVKLAESDVAELFDLDQFADVFEQGECLIDKQNDNALTEGWTCQQYRRSTFAKVGYFHRQDHRSTALGQYQGEAQGEPFELYQLEGSNDKFGVDIEVFEDGDTDVLVHIYRPLTDIKDMFPGS
ncbi:hypothetical protein QWY77_04100 [Thalassotalea ponticola]|uniref:hypothetical protein n=1 Tax=Thalassotalea ponticola TaxID=1523392 RepID=UPI0025B4559B|nr:hypothetical protein [Thalassotalea ponticola]MDN3651949.1 hypothetical protein [Thalassotalea ponticola]